MKLSVRRTIGLAFRCGLVSAASLSAQVVPVEGTGRSAHVLEAKPPVACPTGQIMFQRFDGKMMCIASDANPCPQGQVLDKPASGPASCKAIPAKAPFTCPAGQLAFQRFDGKMMCIASDANPCPQGQVLEKPAKTRVKTSAPHVAACKALPAKAPFTCEAGLIVFQQSSGKLVCIASDSNPCPQGQALDTSSPSKPAVCKGLPAKAPIACPEGKVAKQDFTGKWRCVDGP